MAKIIYCLEIIFRSQLTLPMDVVQRLRDFNIFVVKVYLKNWFTCSLPINAPLNDLQFYEEMLFYKKVNETIALAAVKAFSNHLWYLNESLASLAFFDNRLSLDNKRQMLQALRKPSSDNSMALRIRVDHNLMNET